MLKQRNVLQKCLLPYPAVFCGHFSSCLSFMFFDF